ncbi:hypothetical protein N7466_008336 [Penicillium verhagenii]|uniref:uncharacterized protein n=1 Tax=Penicillium verhagenii TaxID=1562060 RepID=UPI002545570A|nr:uncharacterized protein N7466_008336 [Penicillium verhagenii]KAJ5924149.1 hypothetical protein N7466_008336 [Penicillium verhagenii]
MSDTVPEGSVSPVFRTGSGNVALGIAVIAFMSIALYNALELSVLIPLSFRRYNSLYFWALLISTVLGVIPATIGPSLEFFNLSPLWLSLTLSNIGFVCMVPNQSVVLYSRLHLVSQNPTVLSMVRWLVIAGGFVVIPTIVMNFGSSYRPQESSWTSGFNVLERLQLTWFATQEMCISSIYIWETIQLIRLSPKEDKRRHKILYELIAINVAAICMDISLLVLEYLGFYYTQVIFKATVYSVKLKLEFAVLGMLVSIVRSHSESAPPTWQADWTSSTFS